jgi:hypothetical protein
MRPGELDVELDRGGFCGGAGATMARLAKERIGVAKAQDGRQAGFKLTYARFREYEDEGFVCEPIEDCGVGRGGDCEARERLAHLAATREMELAQSTTLTGTMKISERLLTCWPT